MAISLFRVSGVAADAGPGLVFITLPNVFTMAFHGYPILGYVFSGLFYLLLLLAALTSAMSLHESVAAYVLEVTHIKRKTASALVAIACATLGAACSLSFGPWEHVTCFSMSVTSSCFISCLFLSRSFSVLWLSLFSSAVNSSLASS